MGGLAKGVSAALKITVRVDQAGIFINTAARTAASPQDMNPENDSDDVGIKTGGTAMPWLELLLF